jgi:hypothetical protein
LLGGWLAAGTGCARATVWSLRNDGAEDVIVLNSERTYRIGRGAAAVVALDATTTGAVLQVLSGERSRVYRTAPIPETFASDGGWPWEPRVVSMTIDGEGRLLVCEPGVEGKPVGAQPEGYPLLPVTRGD